MHQVTILIFVAHYLPGYKSGGPVRTIANLVEHLGNEFNFRIVTACSDFLDTEPYANVTINAWNQVGNAQVFYCSPRFLSLMTVYKIVRETSPDILYLNSFFTPKFTGLPLVAARLGLLPRIPFVLSPSGEFSQGALELKGLKKKLFIKVACALSLYDGVTWQASSEHEAADIQRIMGKKVFKDIFIAPNLPQQPNTKTASNYQPRNPWDPLRLVFLSRVSPMKNLDYALKVLERVRIPIIFDIYGLIDDEAYWKKCKPLLAGLPDHIIVNYHGAIQHENVAETLAKYDLFFLPTRGENYGHAIYEALAVGTPALISDQTPWRDLEQTGVGWVLSLDNNKPFADVIERLFVKNNTELAEQRRLAEKYAYNIVENGMAIKQNVAMFRSILSKRL